MKTVLILSVATTKTIMASGTEREQNRWQGPFNYIPASATKHGRTFSPCSSAALIKVSAT